MQRVFADRKTDAKQNNLAMLSTTQGHYLAGPLLKLDLDGMDQAKFKCPRLVANKAFDGLWKPTLHLVCVLIHGLLEIYFCFDGDMKKDSHCQRTVLPRPVIMVALSIAGPKEQAGMRTHMHMHARPHPVCLRRPTTPRGSTRTKA